MRPERRATAPRPHPGRRAAPGPSSDPAVAVAVDVVPFALRDGRLLVGLVELRGAEGGLGHAFPGGRVRSAESLDQAARRWLEERIAEPRAHLEQLYTFGEPGRDPWARVVSVAYLALLPEAPAIAGLRWFSADALPPLAYDHAAVAEVARARLRAKLGYTNVAYALLPETFTLAELQQLYESVLGLSLDRRNFRKRALALGILAPAGAERRGAHRPAQLYRFAQRRPVTIAVLGERR